MKLNIPSDVKLADVLRWANSLGYELRHVKCDEMSLVKREHCGKCDNSVRFLRARTTDQLWPAPGGDGPNAA